MFPKRITVAVALLLLLPNASPAQEASAAGGANTLSPSAIFQFTNIWTIHLSFTPEQWEAMEPKQQGRPQFGGRRGSGSFLQGPEGGRNGIAAAFGIVFDYVHADLEFGPCQFKDVGVRSSCVFSGWDSAGLRQSAAKDPTAADLVKLKYFVGMNMEEAAAALGLSLRNAERTWAYARAWLRRKVTEDGS